MQEPRFSSDNQPTGHPLPDAAIAGAVFLYSAFVLWWLFGQRLNVAYGNGANHEGIFLDGACRILAGQVPYRDFFVSLGPDVFWIPAAFATFGVTLGAAYVLPVGDVALIAACLY